MQINNLQKQVDFIKEIDKIKYIQRKSRLFNSDRRENDAEHSWHLAVMAIVLAEHSDKPIDLLKVLKMVLIHDIVEIDAGDTFLYADSRGDAHVDERAGITRLQSERGNGIADLSDVWEEQETGHSKETQLLRVVDRLLPFLLNLNTNGKTWIDANVTRSQVAGAHEFIKDSFPSIHDWLAKQIDYATKQGWLIDA